MSHIRTKCGFLGLLDDNPGLLNDNLGLLRDNSGRLRDILGLLEDSLGRLRDIFICLGRFFIGWTILSIDEKSDRQGSVRKKGLNQDFQDYRITRIKKFVSPIDDSLSEALF